MGRQWRIEFEGALEKDFGEGNSEGGKGQAAAPEECGRR
jgi:hypothetical protein